jgi:hypothetical protein
VGRERVKRPKPYVHIRMIFPQSSSGSDAQGSDSKLDSSGLGSVHSLDSTPTGGGLRGGITGPQSIDVLAERSRQLQAKMLDRIDSDATDMLLFKQHEAIGLDSISGHMSGGGDCGFWCNTPTGNQNFWSKDSLYPNQDNDRSPLVGTDRSETDTLLNHSPEEFSTSDPIERLTARVSSLEQEMRTIAAQRPIIIEHVENMHSNPGGISQSISGGSTIHGGLQASSGDQNSFAMGANVSGSDSNAITQDKVHELLSRMELVIQQHELPANSKDEAIAYLGAAKKAAEKEEPNKSLMAGNLKGVQEAIKVTSETLESSKSLWKNVEPILLELSGWLGVAKDFF